MTSWGESTCSSGLGGGCYRRRGAIWHFGPSESDSCSHRRVLDLLDRRGDGGWGERHGDGPPLVVRKCLGAWHARNRTHMIDETLLLWCMITTTSLTKVLEYGRGVPIPPNLDIPRNCRRRTRNVVPEPPIKVVGGSLLGEGLVPDLIPSRQGIDEPMVIVR